MDSKKKASEGIAFLSMYGDEDDEIEDLDEEREDIHEVGIPSPALDAVTVNVSNGLSAIGGVLNVTSAASDVTARDARPNKKSKWDKRSSLTTGEQENHSAVGAHAALLSAAKAGSGYSAFAQQRRKEAEDKWPSDRR